MSVSVRFSLSCSIMCDSPGKSKQSDGAAAAAVVSSAAAGSRVLFVLYSVLCGKLCVMGGFCYVFNGAAPYTSYTDWL